MNNQLTKTLKANVETVSARDIHKTLGIGKFFANWIKDRIRDYGLVEGIDYMKKLDLPNLANQDSHGGDRKTIDYHLTIPSAILIAARERSELGVKLFKSLIEQQEKMVQLLKDNQLPLELHNRRVMLIELKHKILVKAREISKDRIKNFTDLAKHHELNYSCVLATINGYYLHSKTVTVLFAYYDFNMAKEHQRIAEQSKITLPKLTIGVTHA